MSSRRALYDSHYHPAAPPQPAAAPAAGARARHRAFPPGSQRQRHHRAAVAHRAGAARGAVARAPRDRRAVPHLQSQHGGRAATHGGAWPGRPPACAARPAARACLAHATRPRARCSHGAGDQCDLPPDRAAAWRRIQRTLRADAGPAAGDARGARDQPRNVAPEGSVTAVPVPWVMAVLLGGVSARAGQAAWAHLPPEPLATEALAARPGPHWVWVNDIAFFAI